MKIPKTAIFLLLFGSTVFAGNSPSTYNAISDNIPRPEPPLPAFGPAGSKIVDPTFGTTILRVTDANTNPEAIGGDFLTPGGSFEVNWNADTTMFWVWTKGGFSMTFRFDAANFSARPVMDVKNPGRVLQLPFAGPFSYRRPNILYATSGRTVVEYDFNTQSSSKVFDGNAAVPGAGGSAYTPSVNDDDSRICLAFGGQQDTHPYVGVLDRKTGRYHVLDTRNSRINGQPANRTLGWGLHSAYMDRSGRYVVMSKGQGRISGQSEWTVWDIDAARVYDIDGEWSGHDASAFGVRVNQSGFYGGEPVFYEEQQWAIRGLGESAINAYKYLLDWRQLPTPHQYIYSGHHSWNNARPDVLVPVVGSIVRDSRQTAKPWRTWDNEIIGVATDGSGKVWRFAHHRAVWDRSNFWDDPRGNLSQDGRWFVFTSNWGRTTGAGRHDIFMVALPADGSPPVQPPPVQPPPVQPPPPSDTVGPNVLVTAPGHAVELDPGAIRLAADAQDESGVAGVQFIVNDQPAGPEDTVAPYEIQWTPAAGQYSIAARARDTKANVSTSPAISVTVKAPAPPPPPPPVDIPPFTPVPRPPKSIPATYTAIADSTVRPQPATPALGPAGSVIADPTFGSRILRVTDGNTLPSHRDSGFGTPAGSFEVNWNADTTMFWVHAKPGAVVFRFDAGALRATPVAGPNGQPLVLPGYGPFSFRRPNILYLAVGRTVAEYDVNTHATATVFDANAAVPGATSDAYTPSVSDDETRIALAFGGQQGTYQYVAVLDRAARRYHVLDTRNSRLNGQATNKALGYGIFSAYMDRTGRYVIIAKGQGRTGSDWLVWDVDAARVYDITSEWSGRDAAGFGVRVNQSGFTGGEPTFYEEQQWALRGLGEQQINSHSYLLDWQQLPVPHQYIYSGQHSWNNARPDAAVPVVGSIVRDASQASLPWRAWDNEILGVATDGSKKVYRFAHHRSRWDRTQGADVPRGNVSQDGRFFVFTSNWDLTLGADPAGGPRRDVFVVALPTEGLPQQPPPPPVVPPKDTTAPVVKLTSPVNGATIPEEVNFTATASDNVGVAAVEFRVDGELVATAPAAPYAAAWTCTMEGKHQHTIAAVASDAAGNTSTSAVTVSSNGVAPPPPPPPPPPPDPPVSPNLLANPGFEQGSTGWAFFDHPRRSIDTGTVHSGSKAAKLGIAARFYATVEQIVPVQAGRVYAASTWLKLDQIGGTRGAGIVLFWLNSSGRQIGETHISPQRGTTPWTEIRQNVTAPVGATRVKFELWCFTDPDDSGTVWFDDAYFGAQ